MDEQVAHEAARIRVAASYHKLQKTLLELVAALNVLEPGGTLVDDVIVATENGDRIRFAFVAKPLQVKIKTAEETVVLKVVEDAGR